MISFSHLKVVDENIYRVRCMQYLKEQGLLRLKLREDNSYPPFPTSCKHSFLWVTSLFVSPSFLSISLFLFPFPSVFFLPLPSFLGTHGRCSSSSSSITSELDDEPACLEEIDYSTDSSSDQEGSFSELDRQIQECAFNKEEGDEEEEGPGQGRKASP